MFAPENEKQRIYIGSGHFNFLKISSTNPTFKDVNGNQKELIEILKENGINTIRLETMGQSN